MNGVEDKVTKNVIATHSSQIAFSSSLVVSVCSISALSFCDIVHRVFVVKFHKDMNGQVYTIFRLILKFR